MNVLSSPVRACTRSRFTGLGTLVINACLSSAALAQQAQTALPAIFVTGQRTLPQRNELPGTTASVTADDLAESINAVNTEDTLKYLPSLIVRKRNYGDQFAPLATRTSGLGQSARSLVYADGILLSTLIGNNNSNSTPRWSMVAPEEIERIDVIYGPFSAAYPGNSMGAVVEITTRDPQAFEASARVLGARQSYSFYGVTDSYNTKQASALIGSRSGPWSLRLSASYLDTQTQPLNLITVAQPAAPAAGGTAVSGEIPDTNRLGQPIFVIGSGGIETKQQLNLKTRVALDLTPHWQANYTFGQFTSDVDSKVQTVLRDASGNPIYSGTDLNLNGYRFTGANAIGAGSFSSTSGRYTWNQDHQSHSVGLKSNTRSEWDWEAVTSVFRYVQDRNRIPGTALPTADASGAGTIVSLDKTGWQTTDLKGYWRPQGLSGPHQVSFGLHSDQYDLRLNTYATADWRNADIGAVNSSSLGSTRTRALWLQDAWRFAPRYKLTLGGRQEYWRGFNGVNFSAAPFSSVAQPTIEANRFSPKASLSYEASRDWQFTASYGRAYRFPTVTELYQAVTVAGVIFTPNPNLRPEAANTGELAAEHVTEKGRQRISMFQENLRDALISQNSTIPGTTTIGSSTQNIDRIRSQGIEVAAQQQDVVVRGLDLNGSFTYVRSRILSDPNFRNAANVLTDVSGKITPNIPRLKASGYATYRYDAKWSGTVGARYSDRVWATVDNTDINPHTYQGFERYFVVDARVNFQADRQTRVSVGIDNLNNRQYFLFHPFPQRTVVAELWHAF